MRERVKRLERENQRLGRERSEAERVADARVGDLQSQLNAARDSAAARAASSGAAASTREAVLAEEVALLKKSSGMDAGMKEKVSKKFMEQKKKIIEQTERINDLESLKVENVRLAHELQEKQEHLERRNAEQQKLEQYVKKALAHANQTVKASQLKYKKSLEIYRKQVCVNPFFCHSPPPFEKIERLLSREWMCQSGLQAAGARRYRCGMLSREHRRLSIATRRVPS